MTPDPETATLLTGVLAPPPLPPSLVQARRSAVELGRALGGPAAPVPTRDVRLAGVSVRLYEPAGAPENALVLYCHGGGWVSGDLESHDRLVRRLAVMSNLRFIAAAYRLAPEHPHPAALDDVRHVYDVLHDRGFRVALMGDSAGGHLAALTAHRLRRDGRSPVFLALLYPILDGTMSGRSYEALGSGYYLTRSAMAAFWAQYCGGDARPPEDPEWSPLHEPELDGMPPTLVLTAGLDPLRDEGRAYARRLAEANVPVEHHEHPCTVHGFLRFLGPLAVARRAAAEVAAWSALQFAAPTASQRPNQEVEEARA